MTTPNKLRKAFVHSKALETLAYPETCPFNTSRAGKTHATLERMGLLSGADRAVVAPEALDRTQLERFHTPEYIDALQRVSRREFHYTDFEMGFGTVETPVFDDLYDYATLAGGATVTAAERLLNRQAVIAFNPSGGYHHAHPARASGFCYINDIVLGCMKLADHCDRILFLDLDVHHDDGVQAAFYDRADIMSISLHESGDTLFPGTGAPEEIGTGAGRGYSVNIPLPVNTYDEAYLRIFEEIALPLIHAYDPEIVVAEFGADALSGDPLAHLSLTNNAYVDLVEHLIALGRPLLITGGGGYHVENTVRAWSLIWTVLCGDDHYDQMHAGLGGVMLESTEWQGGLRDRMLAPKDEVCAVVDAALAKTAEKVKALVFPLHSL